VHDLAATLALPLPPLSVYLFIIYSTKQVETLPCIRVKIKISPESGWADMILLGCEWKSDVHLDRGGMCDFHSNRSEMNSHSDRGGNVNLTWIGVIFTTNRYDSYKKGFIRPCVVCYRVFDWLPRTIYDPFTIRCSL